MRRGVRAAQIRPRRPLAALALALGLAACVTTPVTGRRALNVFSVEDDAQLGTQAYAEVKSTSKVIESGAQATMTERVMQRLAVAAQPDDPGFEWEVVLIDDPQMVNAFCLPGGKMAVYTGILPVTQSEEGLAVVMGHEIAHAIARHGTERMTRAYGADTMVQVLTSALGGDAASWAGLASGVLNVTLNMPHGRDQESEADHIGLIYMARAGYDPREAVEFWTRMSQMAGSGGPPEFLSTHPSHETRVRELQDRMPEALEIYQKSAQP